MTYSEREREFTFAKKKEKKDTDKTYRSVDIRGVASINTDLYIVSIIHKRALVIAFVSSGAIYCVKYILVSEMIYCVSSGTLNSARALTHRTPSFSCII